MSDIKPFDKERVIEAILSGDTEDEYFRYKGKLFLKYDQQELNIRTGQLHLAYKGKRVAVFDELNLDSGDLLTIRGLFGGVEVKINSK